MIRGVVMTVMTVLTAAALIGLAACGPLKAPEMPTPVASPISQVQSVRLVEVGPDANRYMVTVLLTNPNDYALPLLDADYRVQVGEADYRGDTAPNRTLPASGHILVELPAVLSLGSNGEYRVNGSLEMDPPQQLKQVFYEFGLPRPRTSFSGSGAIETDIPSASPAPAPGNSESPAADPGSPAPAPTPQP